MRLADDVAVLALPGGRTRVGVEPHLTIETDAAERRDLALAEPSGLIGGAAQRFGATLAQHGLAAETRPARGHVRFVGAGPVAVAAALALARVGVAVGFDDPAASSVEPAGTFTRTRGAVTCAAAARATVDAAGAAPVGSGAPDLTVVSAYGSAVVPARALMADDSAHLVVTSAGGTVTVGPLVLPGITACTVCEALHRTEHDPDWPAVAIQCAARRPRPSALVAPLAGALVAREAVALLQGGAARRWRAGQDGVEPLAPVAPHPDCGCGAALAVQTLRQIAA